jgi:uncharacterized protein (TIRG00374 family)
MDEVTTHAHSQAPVATGSEAGQAAREEMPRVPVTRRNVLVATLFVASALAFLYFVLPKLAGLSETWDRLGDGDPWWLGLAVGLEVLSFFGYVALFRAVFVRGETSRIDWEASYQITMAGLAATRLFAAAGAGGIALTAWAVRRSGMEARVVACRMWAFLVLLYSVFMGALLIDGLFLRIGLFRGPSPFALTIVPAIFAGGVIAIMLAVSLLPSDFERLAKAAFDSPRLSKWARRIATVPATMATGTRTAISILRGGDVGVLGAVAWWGFDIAVLWACFHAFGDAPPQAVIVMGYFVGMLANTLPLPGGIGGVDGGMIGAFIAFGVDGGLAVVAVLVYRGIAFWLPTLPGAIAYLQLRHTVHRWEEEPAAA